VPGHEGFRKGLAGLETRRGGRRSEQQSMISRKKICHAQTEGFRPDDGEVDLVYPGDVEQIWVE
jgi:hypothetical protein